MLAVRYACVGDGGGESASPRNEAILAGRGKAQSDVGKPGWNLKLDTVEWNCDCVVNRAEK